MTKKPVSYLNMPRINKTEQMVVGPDIEEKMKATQKRLNRRWLIRKNKIGADQPPATVPNMVE